MQPTKENISFLADQLKQRKIKHITKLAKKISIKIAGNDLDDLFKTLFSLGIKKKANKHLIGEIEIVLVKIPAGTFAEAKAVNKFNDRIIEESLKIGKGITIDIAGRKYTDIVGCRFEKTESPLPKSDFHFYDDNGRALIFCSYKDGKRAKDFQQYGGVSQASGMYPKFKKEIDTFAEMVRIDSDGELKSGYSAISDGASKELKMHSIFGKDYGKPFGKNNVQVVLQGDVDIVSFGSSFKIDATHMMVTGQEPKGDYDAEISTVKKDRNEFGVRNSRFGVSPKGGYNYKKTFKIK